MREERLIHTDHNDVHVSAEIGPDRTGHVYHVWCKDLTPSTLTTLSFQNGPVKEVGVNGITNEALLAVLAHRIEYLNGLFPCAENDAALAHVKAAAAQLQARTLSRIARGVEGERKA